MFYTLKFIENLQNPGTNMIKDLIFEFKNVIRHLDQKYKTPTELWKDKN